MKKIELLAPVGSYDAFISAINNGADAIYLAGRQFGAREKATFSNEEIASMIKYSHIREVRVHVVINTLIYDDEVSKVMEFVDFLYNNDVDAVIVQDLGIINLIHHTYPDLEIHASTQVNTTNSKQAQILKNLGVKRVILAREANIEVVKDIKEKTGLDVEVFAHGALCMGYSGQCLFSSFTMKKSGNRGECLQLCRLPYSFYVNDEKVDLKDEYLLSCKDLSTLDYLDKFIDYGVTSIKIEGRVKSASYVGKVVGLYRKYLDKYYLDNNVKVDNNDLIELKKVFNRGFTKGYIFNEKSRDIVNGFRPNNIGVRVGVVNNYCRGRVSIKLEDNLHQGDGIRIINNRSDKGMFINKLFNKGLLVNSAKKGDLISLDLKEEVNSGDIVYKTSDYLLNKVIEDNNRVINKRFPIKVKVSAFINENLVIEASDDLNNVVSVSSEFVIDRANKTPTSGERIKEQIAKLNDSVYYLDEFNIEQDEMIIIPISVINKLRNKMIEELNNKREVINSRVGRKEFKFKDIRIDNEEFSYVYKVENDTQYEVVKRYTSDNNIYYKNDSTIYSYPRISNGKLKVSNGEILINELSDIDTNKKTIANMYMNTTNIYALYTLFSLGVKRVCLSLELGLERIKNMIDNYQRVFGYTPNIEVLVYGKIDLMITKHCIINKVLTNKDINCNKCKDNKFYLMDRKGYKLELIKDGLCNIRIINPKRLHLLEYCNELKDMGVSKLRLEFTNESDSEIVKVIEGYKNKYLILDNASRGYFKEEKE